MSHGEVKASMHLISTIHCRVPNLRDLMPDDLRQSWCNNRNKVHNKGYVFESSPNHFPPPPGLWKNWLPWNWSLVPKRLGPAAPMILKQWIHSEIFKYHSYSWLPFLHSKSQPNNYNCIVFPLWKSFSCVWLFVTPRNSPGQNIEVCSLSLLQGIFLTQGWNPGLLHCRRILHQLSHKGRPSPLCQKPSLTIPAKENSPITLQCISQDRLGYVAVTNSSTFLLALSRVIFLLT